MSDLSTRARELDKTLAAASVAIDKYFETALAAGFATGDPTGRGLDGRQLRQKLQNHVVAFLSPKPRPGTKSILQFTGAPEARRYTAVHGIPR